MSQGAELLQLAEEETREAKKRLERVLREVASAEGRVVARMDEVARVRDEAARQYNALTNLQISVGRSLRGSMGVRAAVADLEKMLEMMRAALQAPSAGRSCSGFPRLAAPLRSAGWCSSHPCRARRHSG